MEGKKKTIQELEKETYAPDFWQDREAAQKLLKRISSEKESVQLFSNLVAKLEDSETLWQLAVEADDDELAAEAKNELNKLKNDLESVQLALLLSEEYDDHNAILTLHAGAGGVEAQDWVEMLLRMYTRYCDRQGYKAELIDFLEGEEAGVKSATLSIEGDHAYGYFKCERGVHRLVRISPFDAAGRRHTSFASVDIMPQVEDNNEIEINEEDLRIDTYRSSGKGGQHVNKTDSAVRITHLPTGIVVQCQDERSQFSNKERAMKLLAANLLHEKIKKREAELAELKGSQQEIGWGSQIRSYVFQPYRLVKDHRTNYEVGNVEAVMDGDIKGFIAAYLKKQAFDKY